MTNAAAMSEIVIMITSKVIKEMQCSLAVLRVWLECNRSWLLLQVMATRVAVKLCCKLDRDNFTKCIDYKGAGIVFSRAFGIKGDNTVFRFNMTDI